MQCLRLESGLCLFYKNCKRGTSISIVCENATSLIPKGLILGLQND